MPTCLPSAFEIGMKFRIGKAKVMSPNPISSSSSSCSLREVDSVGQVFPPIHAHKEGVKVKVDPQLSNKSLPHQKDRDQARKAVGKRRGVPCRTSNRLRIKQEREEHTRNADKPESEQGHLGNQNLFIKYGHNKNPYHKILFLHRLGLSPKSGAPFRRFERISFLPDSLSALENQSKVSLLDRAVGEKGQSLNIGNRAKLSDLTVRSRDDNHRRQRQQEIHISPVTCQSVPEPNSNLPGVTDVTKIDYKIRKDPTLQHQNNVKLLASVPHSGHSTPISPPLKIPADLDVIVIEVDNKPSHLNILRNSMHKHKPLQQEQEFAQNRKSDSSDVAVPYPHRQATSTTSNKLFPIFAFGQKQKQRSNLSNGCGANRNNNDANKSKPHQSSLSFKTIAHQMKYRNVEINNATKTKPPQKLRPRILRRQVSSLQTSGNVRSRRVPVPVPAQNVIATPVPVVVPASSVRVLQPQPTDEIQVIDLVSDEDEELLQIRKKLATWDTEVQVISE